MSDDRDSGASGVILSFLVGGLVGAAVAILFAPRSGRETREMLSERLREGSDRGRRFRDRAIAKGRELIDDAGEYVERQKEGIERQRDRISAAVEAGRQAYREDKDRG